MTFENDLKWDSRVAALADEDRMNRLQKPSID